MFKTNIFGILPFRDVILEVWSVTGHEVLLCHCFMCGYPQSLGKKSRWARENWRNQEGLESPVSLVAVLSEEHSPSLCVFVFVTTR